MRHLVHSRLVLALCALVLSGRAAAAAASTTYDVTINTAHVVGHPAGPFSVIVSLVDGSGLSDASSTVTLTNVSFGGGAAGGDPSVWGGASGSLETGVTLVDNQSVSTFAESFSPGATLRFSLSQTTTTGQGAIPDRLSISITDRFGARIPTLASVGDVLIGLDVGWLAGSIDTFPGDTSRAPTVGAPILIDTPSVVPVCTVEVTARLTVMRGGFLYNAGTQLFSQTVKLTNVSGEPIAGPLYLLLDTLNGAASLANVNGESTCTVPGSPTIGVVEGGLAPGASATIVLQFTDPTKAAITYFARALSGSSAR